MELQAKLLLDAVTGDIGSLTNGATGTSANIDTLGVEFVTIDVAATTQSVSTQAGSPFLLKLQESDITVASTFVDVVGFRGGPLLATNLDFVVGIGNTSGPNAYKFNVDMRGRMRYLNVVATPTTTQTFIVTANGFGARPPLTDESGFYTGIAENTRKRRYHFWATPHELIERCFLEDGEEPRNLWSVRAPRALSVTVRDAILEVVSLNARHGIAS